MKKPLAKRTTPKVAPEDHEDGTASQPRTIAVDAWPPSEHRFSLFDPLDMLRRSLMAQDMLFLSRQVTYHLAAAESDLQVFADTDQSYLTFSRIIEHIVRRSPRGGSIEISLRECVLRSGPGIEVELIARDRHLEQLGNETLLATLFAEAVDAHSGIALSQCRESIRRQHGRLWADLRKPGEVAYHIILPSSEEAARQPSSESQTFKYDIFISNYATVRKHYGIRKSQSLVQQVEHYVRSLVRYPMDMVTAIADKGMVTTIYETQSGGAESVASRISQRLGKEEFRIGRKPVELTFRYQLSSLTRTEHHNPHHLDKRSV